jgi:hypothetical protein
VKKLSFRQTSCVTLIYTPAHSSEQINGLKIFAIVLKITKLYREDNRVPETDPAD